MESQSECDSQRCILGGYFVLTQQAIELIKSEQLHRLPRDSTVETISDDGNQAELNNRVQRKDGDDAQAHNDLFRELHEKLQECDAYLASSCVPTPEALRQHLTSPGEDFNRLPQNKNIKLQSEGSYVEISPPAKKAKLEDNGQNKHSMFSFWCGFCRCMVPSVSDTSDPLDVCLEHFGDHLMGRPIAPRRTALNGSTWKIPL